jgi:hypothetical protein
VDAAALLYHAGATAHFDGGHRPFRAAGCKRFFPDLREWDGGGGYLNAFGLGIFREELFG